MTTIRETLQSALDEANPNKLADALQQVKLGSVLTPVRATFTGLADVAAHDLTDAAHGELAPILVPLSVRVTAGTGAVGNRALIDAAGTPAAPGANGVGLATLSADGKTITFEAGVTAFIVEYLPRSYVDTSADFTRA